MGGLDATILRRTLSLMNLVPVLSIWFGLSQITLESYVFARCEDNQKKLRGRKSWEDRKR